MGATRRRCWHLGKQVPADTTFATKAATRAWHLARFDPGEATTNNFTYKLIDMIQQLV